jgi:predicted DCC family thiol-disulfide oxidoreductase YuxK
MTDQLPNAGAWFVYDGECPMCTSAAHALRIKEEYGSIHLLNARESADHIVVKEVTKRGLDLDEGMVIYVEGQFHHGKDALKFMAKYGDSRNVFTAFCKVFFRFDFISSLTYPWMRGVRNLLLKRKHVGRIDNLELKKEPLFRDVFGARWDDLSPAFQKYYSIPPYGDDEIMLKGKVDVYCASPLRWLSPILSLLGQVPVVNEKEVPAALRLTGNRDVKVVRERRSYAFNKSALYTVRSQLVPLQDGEVIKLMPFGFGWKAKVEWDDHKVSYTHQGYIIRLFGHFVPLPITWILGQVSTEEMVTDTMTFEMHTRVMHPWWGCFYKVFGQFKILK